MLAVPENGPDLAGRCVDDPDRLCRDALAVGGRQLVDDHPVHVELATGTGPCRQCLRPFDVGQEQRILFTHRPVMESGTITAPGPVFIHHAECRRYDDAAFPPGLRDLPLLFEARASDGRVVACRAAAGDGIERVIVELLEAGSADYLYIRHAEAGCFIAQVDPED